MTINTLLFKHKNLYTMFRLIKLFLINCLILLTLIICVDLIFGYWFKEYNFGPQLRGKRIQKISEFMLGSKIKKKTILK